MVVAAWELVHSARQRSPRRGSAQESSGVELTPQSIVAWMERQCVTRASFPASDTARNVIISLKMLWANP
jgi:hypothetical protein